MQQRPRVSFLIGHGHATPIGRNLQPIRHLPPALIVRNINYIFQPFLVLFFPVGKCSQRLLSGKQHIESIRVWGKACNSQEVLCICSPSQRERMVATERESWHLGSLGPGSSSCQHWPVQQHEIPNNHPCASEIGQDALLVVILSCSRIVFLLERKAESNFLTKIIRVMIRNLGI